jgi:hypothetical protein
VAVYRLPPLNSHEGGIGGRDPVASTRVKIGLIAKSNIGQKRTAQTRALLSLAAQNRPPISQERRDALAARSRGNTYRRGSITPDETRKKQSVSAKNRSKPSAETCAKISAALSGRAKSQDHIANATAAQRCKPKIRTKEYSDQERLNRMEGARKMWERRKSIQK